MALKREDVIRVTKELLAEYGEDYETRPTRDAATARPIGLMAAWSA